MISILDRYILKQVLGLFLFGVGLFTVLLAVNDIFGLVRIAVSQHIAPPTVLRLLLLRLPNLAVASLPMALLLAVLMTAGRLSEHNEVVAMRTGGISLGRMSLPVLVVAALVAVGGAVLAEWTVPLAEDRFAQEISRATRQPPSPRGYVLFREVEGPSVSVYYARRVAEGGDVLEGLVVNQFEAERLVRVIEARRARYSGGRWEFQEGTVHLLSATPPVELAFHRLEARIRRTPREILAQHKDPSQMTIRELRAYIAVLRRTGEAVLEYLVWMHARMALPSSSLPFALLAIPLGLRPHRGGPSIGLGLTVLIILIYYLLTNATLALGQTGRLPPLLAAWTPNLLLAVVGGFLLWRAR